MVATSKRIETRPQRFIHRFYTDTRLKYKAQFKYLISNLGQLCGVSLRLSIFFFNQLNPCTTNVYIQRYVTVLECGIVYGSAQLDAMFLTEFT